MDRTALVTSLVDTCSAYTLPADAVSDGDGAIQIEEPYIPYIPDSWNRVLVLAEAQNLSQKYAGYRSSLADRPREQLITRLYLGENGRLGVRPWDNGCLKIAVEAALKLRADETAVSNAVLWSLVNPRGGNSNPTSRLIACSARLWSQLLTVLQPKVIVAAGGTARKVLARISKPAWSGSILRIKLPSPRVLPTLGGLFDRDELLDHYPDVAAVLKSHPDWFEEKGRLQVSRIVFACHAVSMTRRQKRMGDLPALEELSRSS